MLCQYLVFCWYYSWQKGAMIILIQCCETNCWHLEPRKYLETGLCVVAGCSVLVFELSNSATSKLTIKNGMCDGGARHHSAIQLHWTTGMLLDVDFDNLTWIWTKNVSLLKFTENLCAVVASWGWIFVHMPESGRVKFWDMDKGKTNTILGVEPYEICWVCFLGNRMWTG
jgi:hypothetical protein